MLMLLCFSILLQTYSIVGMGDNNNIVTMGVNLTQLKIEGNNCNMRAADNLGEIEVIGNDCRIELTDNHGVITVVGNNAMVIIGKRWPGDRVEMRGDNNKLIVAGKNTVNYEAQLSPFSKDLNEK